MNGRQLRELLGPLGNEPTIGALAPHQQVTPREQFEAQERHRSAMRLFWVVSGVAAMAGLFFTHRRLAALEERKR